VLMRLPPLEEVSEVEVLEGGVPVVVAAGWEVKVAAVAGAGAG